MTTSRIDREQHQDRIRDNYYNLGSERFDENKWNEALVLFNQTLALTPNNIDALYMRGRTHLILNSPDKGREDFKKIVQLEPFNPHAHYLHGLGLYQLRDYQEAFDELKECLKINPDDSSACIYQGWSLLKLKMYDQAIRSFKKAIQISPNFHAYYQYGRALCSIYHYEKAILNFDECLARNPTYYYAYFRKGQILWSLKKKEEAELSFKTCVNVAPNRFITWYLYALGLFLLEKYHHCLLACEESLKRCIDFPSAISLKKETEAKLKSLSGHTKENFIMLQRIEQINIQNLQDLQKKQSQEIAKLNAEITELKIKLNEAAEQDQKQIDLEMKHIEENQKLHAELKRHEQIVTKQETQLTKHHQLITEQDNKIIDLKKKHSEEIRKLFTEISELKNQKKLRAEEDNKKITKLETQNIELHAEVTELKKQVQPQQIYNKTLLDAAVEGKLDQLEAAHTLGAIITIRNENGLTALHLAILNGHQKAAKLILKKAPALFMTTDDLGYIPMQYAAEAQDLELLTWLYKQGKNIPEFYNDPNEFNKVYKVATDEAKHCLANLKLLDSAKTENMNGVIDALEKDADINCIGPDGSALHIAIYCKHKEIVQLLLEKGADPTILHFNENALDLARGLIPEIIPMLVTPFFIFAADHSNIENMKIALAAGANLIGKDAHGQTALHKAIYRNNINAIKFLLQKHAELNQDIRLLDNEKITPFDLAKKLNNTVTTRKGKEIETDFYLGKKFGKYIEKRKNEVEALSNSRFGFINIIGGEQNTTPTAPPANSYLSETLINSNYTRPKN